MKPLPPNLTPPNPDAVILGWGRCFIVPEGGFSGWMSEDKGVSWIPGDSLRGCDPFAFYSADRESEVAILNHDPAGFPTCADCQSELVCGDLGVCNLKRKSPIRVPNDTAVCLSCGSIHCVEVGAILEWESCHKCDGSTGKPEPESDTPRTAAKCCELFAKYNTESNCPEWYDLYEDLSDFTSELERENRGLRAALGKWSEAYNESDRVEAALIRLEASDLTDKALTPRVTEAP